MKFQKMKNLQQNVGCQRLEVWYVSTMLICERFLHGTSPCGKVGVYIALKHTCNDMTSVQSPPKASTWLCLGWVKFHTENVFPTCNNSGTFPAWVLTCRIWDSRILVLSLWEEDDHLGWGTALYTGAGLPGWVWAGMKTSPTLWLVEHMDMSWGSAWPHSRGGRTYSCGGDTAPEHPRKQELRTGPLSSFLHKLHISWPKGLVTTFWQRVSSQEKHQAQTLELLLEDQHRALWKSPHGIGVWAFLKVPCREVVWAPAAAITGLHVPVPLLLGLFSLREAHALPASHTSPAEGAVACRKPWCW